MQGIFRNGGLSPLAKIFLLGCAISLLSGLGAASVEVLDPNGGETVTGSFDIDFTADTSVLSSDFRANIFLGSSPVGRDETIATNINLLTLGGFSPTVGWDLTNEKKMADSIYDLPGSGTSKLNVFFYDGAYRAVFRRVAGSKVGFSWTGSAWVVDSDWAAGFQADFDMRHSDTVEVGGDIYLIGEYVDHPTYAVQGYKYNTTTDQWDLDGSILNGLPGGGVTTFHDISIDIFEFDDEVRLLWLDSWASNTYPANGANPVLRSYYWNVNTWVEDGKYKHDFNAVATNGGLCTGGDCYSLEGYDVFVANDTLYRLSRNWSIGQTNPQIVNGFRWNGTAWVVDYDINAALQSNSSAARWGLEVEDMETELVLWEFADYEYGGVADLNTYFFTDGFYNTTGSTNFSFPWDSSLNSDGEWYIEVEVVAETTSSETFTDSSDSSFTVDNGGESGVPTTPAGVEGEGVAIYIQASEGAAPGAKMHNWESFSAGSGKSYPGRVMIDGVLTNTCNYDWDCQIDLNVGNHKYVLYSTIGNFLYIGYFSVDVNTTVVGIYVPITYNVFDIFTDDSETALVQCDDLYSVDLFGRADEERRITSGIWVDGGLTYLNSNTIIPRNCYASPPYNVNNLYSWALPGYDGVGVQAGVESMIFTYTDSTGSDACENECLFGLHMLSGETEGILLDGWRDRQGKLNFYRLDAVEDYVPGSSQTFSGSVSQIQENVQDGFLSPITTITPPGMNIDSALFGDANYNPGDFGFGDNIFCEAKIITHGFLAYDVNVLLIIDKNAVYDSFSFSPYQKYNTSLTGGNANGWGSIVWHKFSDVNPGHSADIQCAFEVTNEIGFTSGWAISEPRTMHASNASVSGGINIFVKDEDGSISYLRHKAPSDGDENSIDYYNFDRGLFSQFDTAVNPLTLFEGENVMAFTEDSNSNWIAAKTFNVGRNSLFDISLYLPDIDSSNQDPVIRSTQLRERGAYGRMECQVEFYDKDLDFNGATFKFWTNQDGSFDEPNCEQNLTFAYTTNCNLNDARNPFDDRCYATGYNSNGLILSECGQDNDCFIQANFAKRECTEITGGAALGFCAVAVEDSNGNVTVGQASANITVQQYDIFAICEAYALVDGEREAVIFTEEDVGYVECEIGTENLLTPDSNFNVEVEGVTLNFINSNFDEYLGLTTHVFRENLTGELAAYAVRYSTDGENWEGEIPVFISHETYGSEDTFVRAAVVFVGSREYIVGDRPMLTAQGEGFFGMDQTDFENWFYGMFDAFLLMVSNPLLWIQQNFFLFLVLIFLIIVGMPLVLYAMAITGKARKGEG